AEDNLIFLLKWFERFPQYKETEFYIGGESYAGHFVPQLSQLIVKHNSATKQNSINLKGYMVGNALTDDFNDQLGIFQFMWATGMISDQTFKLLNLLCDFQSVEHPSQSCQKMLDIADDELGNIDPYSIFTPPCHGSANQRLKRTLHHDLSDASSPAIFSILATTPHNSSFLADNSSFPTPMHHSPSCTNPVPSLSPLYEGTNTAHMLLRSSLCFSNSYLMRIHFGM
ncbi:serine carboxypeptidase II-2-like protein, partial [Trifolium pratense]